jgi:predicted DNA-binding transcriptional regulator AlpA
LWYNFYKVKKNLYLVKKGVRKVVQDYYSASEAMTRLGLSKTEFFRKVNSGQIPKITQPGRKQGVYPKRDIDALTLAMNLVFEINNKIVFSKSTPGDQVEEMDIGIRCFGSEYITPLPERIAFQQKSEFTFWSLKVDGHVKGYISMFHFPSEFLDDILTGRKIEREITVKEVLPFIRLKPFDVYIDVMAVDPDLPHHLRNLYAGIMISRLADKILDLYDNGYVIQKLYTVTATKEGDSLVNKLGFNLMRGKSLARGRIAYEFDLDEEGIKKLKGLGRRSI